MLPSALVQVMLTSSTSAPAKSVGVVTVSEPGSSVCTVQLPSPLLVPAFSVQPDGIPVIVTRIESLAPTVGSVSARLIASPAIPAGATPDLVLVLPARSVMVTVTLCPSILSEVPKAELVSPSIAQFPLVAVPFTSTKEKSATGEVGWLS
ncbi:hypothetical protein D3C85_930160 [compost metagenome]